MAEYGKTLLDLCRRITGGGALKVAGDKCIQGFAALQTFADSAPSTQELTRLINLARAKINFTLPHGIAGFRQNFDRTLVQVYGPANSSLNTIILTAQAGQRPIPGFITAAQAAKRDLDAAANELRQRVQLVAQLQNLYASYRH